MPAKPTLSPKGANLLIALGARMRAERLHQRLTAGEVAKAAGVTRPTLDRAERGDPAVTAGTLVSVLEALGLDGDLNEVAAGNAQRPEAPARRQGTTAPRRIFLKKYDQLRQLAWSRPDRDADDASLGPTEALQLYERNWRFLDPEAMSAVEKQLVERLVATIGNGVMLV